MISDVCTQSVGCKNSNCVRTNECLRASIYKNKSAREVKSFVGTPQKGCGKFLLNKQM